MQTLGLVAGHLMKLHPVIAGFGFLQAELVFTFFALRQVE